MSRWSSMLLIVLVTQATSLSRAELDFGTHIDVKENRDELRVDALGRDEPVTVREGFLFIDLKYVPPPYRIERVGRAVLVNQILLNRLYGDSVLTSNRLGEAAQNWRHSLHGVKPDTPKLAAQANSKRIARELAHNRAVFLSGKRLPALSDVKDVNQAVHLSMRLPLTGKLRQDEFQECLRILFSDRPSDMKPQALSKVVHDAGQVFKTANDLRLFEQENMHSTNFITRLSSLLGGAQKSKTSTSKPAPER